MPESAAPSWFAFVDALAVERAAQVAPRPVRAMAEQLASQVLTLLFPQFARGDRGTEQGSGRTGDTTLRDDAAEIERLLGEAIGPLVVDARATTSAFLACLPEVHRELIADAHAILDADPAAASLDEVVLAYPGFLATAVHRFAHELYRLDVPLIPRLLSEWAHRETGIDIHPGANIGRGFAIDHGTGVVIGETSEIGERVRIYQGVTLGALAVSKKLASKKRHPTIGHDVVIYANATILGGNTIVGDGSIIGGNVWLTASVPPRSVVQFSSRVEPRALVDDGLEFHI